MTSDDDYKCVRVSVCDLISSISLRRSPGLTACMTASIIFTSECPLHCPDSIWLRLVQDSLSFCLSCPQILNSRLKVTSGSVVGWTVVAIASFASVFVYQSLLLHTIFLLRQLSGFTIFLLQPFIFIFRGVQLTCLNLYSFGCTWIWLFQGAHKGQLILN